MEPLGFALAATAFSGVIWASFKAANAAASADFKRQLGDRISSFDLDGWLKHWPNEALQLFSQVFGRNPLSFRFLSRSFLLSTSLLLFTTVTYIGVSTDYTVETFLKWNWDSSSLEFKITPFLTNFVADYISLIETLGVIWLIRRYHYPWIVFLLLLLDIFLTAEVYLVTRPVIQFLLRNILEQDSPSLLSLITGPLLGVTSTHLFTTIPSDQNPIRGMTFFSLYTTFFTSVWIWIYVAAMGVASLGTRMTAPLWKWLRSNFLDLEENTLTSVGFVACLITFLCASIGYAVFVVATVILTLATGTSAQYQP